MKVFNNSQKQKANNTPSTRRCGYCGIGGHVQTECENAISDWAFWSRYEVPLKDPRCWVMDTNGAYNHGRWYQQPAEWGKWYLSCEKAITKIKAKQDLSKKGVSRRTSKCGFCGDTEHNRRACPEMDTLLDRFVLANQKWRQRFYDRLVADLGLSVGAVVKCSTQKRYNHPSEEVIGIVTSINWNELSMFCHTNSSSGRWAHRLEDKFRQMLTVKVKVGGKTTTMTFNDLKSDRSSHVMLTCTKGEPLADTYSWNAITYISTIARSETPLDKEWVEEARRDSLVFLVKKYSMESLEKWNVIRLLEIQEKL